MDRIFVAHIYFSPFIVKRELEAEMYFNGSKYKVKPELCFKTFEACSTERITSTENLLHTSSLDK
jgi:hypothetical protein